MNGGKKRHLFKSEELGQKAAEKTKPYCLENKRNLPMLGSKRKVLNTTSKMASRYLASNLRGPSGKDQKMSFDAL